MLTNVIAYLLLGSFLVLQRVLRQGQQARLALRAFPARHPGGQEGLGGQGRPRPGADRAAGEGAGRTDAGWLTSPAQRPPSGRRGRTRCAAPWRSTSPGREVGCGQPAQWVLGGGGR